MTAQATNRSGRRRIAAAIAVVALLAAGGQGLGQGKPAAPEAASAVPAISDDLGQLQSQLLNAAAQVQRNEARLTALELRRDELKAQDELLRGSLAQRHGSIISLLGAMQRMGRNPPPVMITQREDALQMVRSAMLLAAAFPELREKAKALAEQLKEIARIMDEVRTEQEHIQAENIRLEEVRQRLSRLVDTKKQSLALTQPQIRRVQTEAVRIGANPATPSEMIETYDPLIRANTGLGQYDKERAAESNVRLGGAAAPALAPQAPVQPGAPAAGPAPTPPSPTPPARPAAAPQAVETAVVLAPAKDAVAAANPGRMRPALPFHKARGQLPLPAQGRRVLSFGHRTQNGTPSKGIVIETRHSAQVTSPADGWIVYAGEFRSFGQILIINAGEGYHLLLAGLSQIDVQLGQFVLAGEPVGTMSTAAKPGSAKTQVGAPVLYVEFRKDNKPVDPDPWWTPEQQKVTLNMTEKATP